MKTYKTVLSEKQLTVALIGLDREAKQSLRSLGDTPAFHQQFTTRADEILDTVCPRDRDRASASIQKILRDLGVETRGTAQQLFAAA